MHSLILPRPNEQQDQVHTFPRMVTRDNHIHHAQHHANIHTTTKQIMMLLYELVLQRSCPSVPLLHEVCQNETRAAMQ
jgi:hypothetical protein